MHFKKLRKSLKLDRLSIITRTVGGTSKNTLLINWIKRKKGFIIFCDLSTFFFVTYRPFVKNH